MFTTNHTTSATPPPQPQTAQLHAVTVGSDAQSVEGISRAFGGRAVDTTVAQVIRPAIGVDSITNKR